MLFSQSISGIGLRTILPVPSRQQTDETFDVRLHFAGASQAELFPRAALPEFESLVVARMAKRIATLRLFAGSIFIDLNDGLTFNQSQHLAAQIREPTYKGSGSGFWTFFRRNMARRSMEYGRGILQLFATNCDSSLALRQSATSCNVLRQLDRPDRCEGATKSG
jgi:hypothetical protein